MADRYVALARRPRGYWEEIDPPEQSLTVFEAEDGPVETGLYDANGVPLYRVPERVKMGYRSE